MSHHSIPDDTYKPQSMGADAAKSVLILTSDKTEDLEFFYPYYRMIEAGYRVDVATPKGEDFKGKAGLGLKETMKIADVSAHSYRMLFIPGGKAPSELKKNDEAVALVRQFIETNKPIAAICHGPQLLAEAKGITGKRIAAWPEVQEEIEKAGATYVNQECVTDGQFITARWPGDLPAFMRNVMRALETASGTRVAA